MTFRAAAPNRGHRAVAELVRRGTAAAVITQNIDGPHQASGIPDGQVVELHGNTTYAHCLDCKAHYELDALRTAFEARRDDADLRRLRRLCQNRDDLVRPGNAGRRDAASRNRDPRRRRSSLVVYPAAGFPELAKHNGATLVIINREPTGLDGIADLVLNRSIGETLGAAVGVG